MQSLTIEQLAEKLNGNLWVKGNLKRIYLDKGYNTKKMSTKTFVFQNENGDFVVSCKVECSSQPWQWCKSQEDEVKESVYEQIEEILSDIAYIMTDKEGNYLDYAGKVTELNNSQYYYTETEAKKELDSCTYYAKYITMPRNEFDIEVERLDEIERPERECQEAEANAKREAEKVDVMEAPKEKTKELKESSTIPTEKQRVKHAKFGLGTVKSSTIDHIEVVFDNAEIGLKKLLVKFVKLEIVE